MLRHLRLARGRGSLTAPNNPVQDRALEILDMLDVITDSKARLDQVKVAFATAFSPDRVRDQFPEYFDPFEQAKNEDGTYDIDRIDDSAIEWRTPADEDEDEALSRWIAQQEMGSISAADFENEE